MQIKLRTESLGSILLFLFLIGFMAYFVVNGHEMIDVFYLGLVAICFVRFLLEHRKN